ncbi:restriction endonuclease subunit S [Candidatus Accumulibacter sp. ACC007]|uniref:restriction endonuclease subunit S n=1 Tax=Candidatus Accumulibacter sp. ACC007 TaxID=2823333 RepID=UPI0025B97506|nr:restriction endonuclease subunit S [Candidatus Accumulibacter sp. ACC007]
MNDPRMVRLRDLGRWAGGNTPSKANSTYWTNGTVPWVSPKDMKVDEVTSSEDHITAAALDEGRVSLIPTGSILFVTRSGILAHTLPVAITRLPVTINQDLKALAPKPGVSPTYVALAVRAASRRILNECAKHGTTVASIETNALLDFKIPLVDLKEQHRIVAEIEKQFSRLDEAVANLKRVKANLKRYKAAVLKAAVEGRLVPTEAELAHNEGRDYESGDRLLRRILENRRSQSQGKGKHKELTALDTTDLPDLPEGWTWARLDSIAALKGGITVDSKRQDPTARTVSYLRVANVQRGYLDLNEVKTINAPANDIEELRLQPGDILFNEGGDRDKLGRGWIWEGQLAECIHQNHVFRGRLVSQDIAPKLVSWWGNSFGKDYFQREGKQTTNLASINLTKLSAFPVPLPPLAEQHRIVAEVDRRLSVVREVEAEVDANLKRAQALRQAVLAQAFAPPGATCAGQSEHAAATA